MADALVIETGSMIAFAATAAPVIAGAIIGAVRMLINHWNKKSESDHTKNLELAGKFEGITKEFKEAVQSERDDRKEAQKKLIEVHERTVAVISEVKSTMGEMRIAIEHNTLEIERLKEKVK